MGRNKDRVDVSQMSLLKEAIYGTYWGMRGATTLDTFTSI